jgi:hypothetical protein
MEGNILFPQILSKTLGEEIGEGKFGKVGLGPTNIFVPKIHNSRSIDALKGRRVWFWQQSA